MAVVLDGENLTIEDIIRIARRNEKVEISIESKKKVKKCRKFLEALVKQNKVIYGVTRGFGDLSDMPISFEDIKKLQKNLIKSHSAGVGDPAPEDVTIATMAIRANTLASGYSGIRYKTLAKLVEMINKDVHPIIPEKGSVGASGDLAPLAHMSLVMMGKGEAIYKKRRMSGKEAMKRAGINKVILGPKEGLALINGTSFLTSYAALSAYDSKNLAKCADIAATMSLEALKTKYAPFDEKIHLLRPHKGQKDSAENITKLILGTDLINSNPEKVQDAYSLRCTPVVHGATRNAIERSLYDIKIEINSVTDNPIVFDEGEVVLSGGNFHGQPISTVMDYLRLSLVSFGNISERRTARLLDDKLNEGLPGFLIENSGLYSGFMAVGYTAASLTAENKILAHPASVDTIPTCANKEDHVSMGTTAARLTYKVVENIEYILAAELLCAAQALDLRKPSAPGIGIQKAHELIRKSGVPCLTKDAAPSPYINKIKDLIHSGTLVDYVERAIGELK